MRSLSTALLLSSSLTLFATISTPALAQVGSLLNEGFEDVTLLPGRGWVAQNNSQPAPSGDNGFGNWLQGGSSFIFGFDAQAGPPTSYIGVAASEATAPFGSTNASAQSGASLSNWLLTPELQFASGGVLTFSTRAPFADPVPEYLEVRLSTAGSSTNVGTGAGVNLTDYGDFTTRLQTVGSLTSPTAYPGAGSTTADWGTFNVLLPGGINSGSGRFAFRYAADDTGSGDSASQGLAIGIDSVSSNLVVNSIPEPAVGSGVAGFAILGLTSFLGKRRKQVS